MLSINLLPLEEKKIIQMQEATRAVRFFTLRVVLIAAAGLVLLLPGYFYTFLASQDLARSLRLEEEDAQHTQVSEVLRREKKTKDMLDEVRAYLETPSGVSARIEKLFAAGEGIIITSFSITKTGEMTIQGTAATRSQLLGFEDTLRGSGDFLTVTFPLVDFVHERDIKFAAHMTLKSPYSR